MLKRLLAWMRRDDYVRAAIQGATVSAYQAGYEVGRAHGELIGREQLADELVQQFGDEGRQDVTAGDALRIRASQRH
jgi:phage terminase small subunit